MKGSKWIGMLQGFVFGFVLSFTAVASVVTAFDMQVNLWTLALVCFAASAVAGLCYTLPLALAPAGAFAVALGYFWQKGSLEMTVESLLYRLSLQYHRGYNWGLIRWSGRVAEEMELTLPLGLCLLGALLAILVCYSVCRRKSLLPAFVLDILLLGVCFVVNDTVPAAACLYGQFTVLGTLLITHGLRRLDARQASRLTAVALPAVAVLMLLIFVAVPQKTYDPNDAKRLGQWITESHPVQWLLGKTAQTADTTDDRVDLTQVGYRETSYAQMLEMKADFSGTVYLRSRGRDYYDGVSWQEGEKFSALRMLHWPNQQDSQGLVKITTRYAHTYLYLPYYPMSRSMLELHSGIPNTEKLTEYSFSVMELPAQHELQQYQTDDSGLAGYLGQFIAIPDNVKSWAQPLAVDLTKSTPSVYQKAQLIASYVRNSASYNTQTPRMSGSKDFARWFLEESDTGYCIHFATATTVLLQAAGVPARYVTGYLVQAEKDKTVTVTAEDAHAWTEYWLPGFGWCVLDATPPATSPTPSTTAPVPEEDNSLPTVEFVPGGVTEPEEVDTKVSLSALWVFLCIAGVAGILWGQYRIRLRILEKRLRVGYPNNCALSWWQYTEALAASLAEAPPEALLELAQKAKFSREGVSQQELDAFAAYAEDAISRLKSKNIFKRLYYRFVLVLY